MPKTLRLKLLAAALTLAGCQPTPPKPTPEPTPRPTLVMSSQTRNEKAAFAKSHPPYKLFRQKIDMPTILVVAENTTDDQLQSLLWYLRTEIRNAAFKSLTLQPTATLYGLPGYTSGIVDIYRGPKCAGEQYITSGPDPCGSSIHKSASYHWGDGGDPRSDGASLISATGAVTPVFDSTDHWQTDSEAQSDPDGSRQAAIVARIHYATTETAKQSKRGSDIKFFVSTPPDELNALSYQFADEPGRKRFLNEYVFLEQEHLCDACFRTIKLAAAPKPGKSYPIACK
jgi:hypothetical protein